jgi:hypothetical protein
VALTHDLIDEGFAEIEPWTADTLSGMKFHARTELSALLGEEITAGLISKSEFLDLLTRARKALPR